MLDLNLDYVLHPLTYVTFFFAIPIYLTLVVSRYATLAKLIRDTRTDVENGRIQFRDSSDYQFHIRHYLSRLSLLRMVLFLSLLSGLSLCLAFFLVAINLGDPSGWCFIATLIFMSLAMVVLIFELSVSFQALTSHIDFLKTLSAMFDKNGREESARANNEGLALSNPNRSPSFDGVLKN